MPNYNDRAKQNKALAEQQYFDALKNREHLAKNKENLQIGGIDGQTGRYALYRNDGGITTNGQKTFNAAPPSDGFVRASISPSVNAIAVDHRNVKPSRIRLPQEEVKLYPVKVVFEAPDDIGIKWLIGGDREGLLEIASREYTLFNFYYARVITNIGDSLDDWIVQVSYQDFNNVDIVLYSRTITSSGVDNIDIIVDTDENESFPIPLSHGLWKEQSPVTSFSIGEALTRIDAAANLPYYYYWGGTPKASMNGEIAKIGRVLLGTNGEGLTFAYWINTNTLTAKIVAINNAVETECADTSFPTNIPVLNYDPAYIASWSTNTINYYRWINIFNINNATIKDNQILIPANRIGFSLYARFPQSDDFYWQNRVVYPFGLYKHESILINSGVYMAIEDAVITSYANISTNENLIFGFGNIFAYFNDLGVANTFGIQPLTDPTTEKVLINIYEFDNSYRLTRVGEEIVDYIPPTEEEVITLDSDYGVSAYA